MNTPTPEDKIDQEFAAAWAQDQQASSAPSSLNAIGVLLMGEFADAERARMAKEQDWLMDLRQYRGIYEDDIAKDLADRSCAYRRLTAQKIDTATALMLDLLFPASRERNFSVEAGKKPNLPTFKLDQLKAALKAAMNGQDVPQDAIEQAIRQAADQAASKMADVIDDQLAESKYKAHAKSVLFSGHLYGTGVMKGPLAVKEVEFSYQWNDAGKCVPQSVTRTRPAFNAVPIWRFYPDMEATELDHCRYVWEHHRFNKHALLQLADRKGFDKAKAAIIDYVTTHRDGMVQTRTYEAELRSLGDKTNGYAVGKGQYDVFERWGWIEAEHLAQSGVPVPADRMHEVVFANMWMLPDGTVIKATALPFGSEFPFSLYYYRPDETSIFAEGIAAVMRDDQDMVNAATRAALDNAAISAGPQFVFTSEQLAANTDYANVHPFKAWLQTKGDSQYSPVKAIEVPNHVDQLLRMATFFENQADDTTMLPGFASGENPTVGAAGTAMGMGMLLGQQKIVIKNLVANFDDGVTTPCMRRAVAWNMRFHPDDSIKGDFAVQAKGASSLMAKEVRAQQAMQFSQSIRPEEARYIKWLPLLRERAKAAEFDSVVMDDAEAKEAENNPAQQMQQQITQKQAELTLAKLQAQVSEIAASVQKMQAQTLQITAAAGREQSLAMKDKVETAYSAMQAAGVAAQNPTIAPAGDQILRSAGWQDAPEPAPQPESAQMPTPPTAGAGEAQGIQTPQID